MKENKKWVLLACGKLSIGGVQAMLLNYYRNIDREKIQFAFAVQRDFEMPYDKEILRLGGRIHYIRRMDESVFSYMVDLNNVIKEHPEYSIIHCHLNQKNVIPLFVAMLNKIPVRISHSHNISPDKMAWNKRVRGVIMRILIGMLANQKIGCSIAACADLYPFTSRYNLLFNAIELEKYSFDPSIRHQIRKQYHFDDSTIVLGHVGNFSEQKNPGFLIEILKELPEEYQLLLVGGGGDIDNIEQSVAELGLESRVTFTGVTDSAPFFQAMDLFLLPSLFEGLGMVCIEAMASGMPVICSDRVPKEVDIVDECYHLSIDEGVQLWKNMILKQNFFKRKDNNRALSEAGYNIKIEAGKLTEYYQALLED